MITGDQPQITVLMSVYNAEEYLERSIQSILDQSFRDFEFLIINDGSTDKSYEILKQFIAKDGRIILIDQGNIGLTKSLNKGLHLARTEWIARQDADDFSHPERLQKQYDYLLANPDVKLLGSNSIDKYKDGHTSEWGHYDSEQLQKITYFKTPFPHSTAIFHKQTAIDLGGYDENLRTAQDMDLWIKFLKTSRIEMLKTPLITRTVDDNSISGRKKFQQFKNALSIRLKHSPNRKCKMIYHSLRSLFIANLPLWIIKLRHKIQ